MWLHQQGKYGTPVANCVLTPAGVCQPQSQMLEKKVGAQGHTGGDVVRRWD